VGFGRSTIGVDQLGRTDSSVPSNSALDNGAGAVEVSSLLETRMYYRFSERLWSSGIEGILMDGASGVPTLQGRGSRANEGRLHMNLISTNPFDLDDVTWENQDDLSLGARTYIVFRMGNWQNTEGGVLTPRHPGISNVTDPAGLYSGFVLRVYEPRFFTGSARFVYPHPSTIHVIYNAP
jgi:hypothetical protein